jgi:hypothetical protein
MREIWLRSRSFLQHIGFGLALAACSPPPVVSLAPPVQAIRSKDYVDYLKKWSRRGTLRDDFDLVLDVVATLHSPEFRAAYAEHYVTTYKIGPYDIDRVRKEVLADGAGTWEFHVEAATHKFELNDFSSAKTLWRVTLLDDQGHELEKPEVNTSTKRRDFDLYFYPFGNLFSSGWRMRFPQTFPDGTPVVTPETKSLTLRFAGPAGSVDLVWRLR